MGILNFRQRARFQVFDRTGEFDEDRQVVDGPVMLEPHDDRSDTCVSLPVRSVISSTAGVAVEIGPFTLDSRDVVKLYNSLVDHINAFPSEYRILGAQKR